MEIRIFIALVYVAVNGALYYACLELLNQPSTTYVVIASIALVCLTLDNSFVIRLYLKSKAFVRKFAGNLGSYLKTKEEDG